MESCEKSFLGCSSLQCRRIFGMRTLSTSSHLGFSKQRKVGERYKFLPRGWSKGERKEGGGEGNFYLRTPSLPTFIEIKHEGSANYRLFTTLTCAP